ncbi:condensin complex subunit 2 (macronuclear) [Tetrahymena thermophila SB210]|uniref:Condensin complex subunit 2 n=1 Tax=Tetrahymena thermophila (strain SB210) TaxID=312017 RepID=I7MH20_TETTS|nr:condensin complex subunit 2 [Tetrahymena thermophila SB210]EAS02428.3 condensin complex subunit 2 [Tetrahymena thermophila SB210]|eukprot:XP_001022673.3 condensin complex subunit 2 [Tetrahymena thermophila SB210]
MNKSHKGGRLLKKKILQEVQEKDDYYDDEDLLTNEELKMMQANAKNAKNKIQIRVKSDSLLNEYSYKQKMLGKTNNSFYQNRNGINTKKMNNQTTYKSDKLILDEEEDEEEENVLRELNVIDVKDILEDARRKSEGNNNQQKKNQDALCLILAQMLLKNKINKENAFEIPLPDVKNMSDFAKVSEASWQKLSSSIDSGSKIYGYRVDSLHQESFKMLSGLIRSEFINKDEDHHGKQEQDSEDLINKEREKIFKKNKKINESTIEKNLSNITLNKYDIQFEVDPLFCKTSEKFDDSSSKGILLNNIKIDSNLKLLIDSENFVHNLPQDSSARQSLDKDQQNTPMKKKSDKKKVKGLYKNEKLSLQNIQIRSDLYELELCSGLENFVGNMLNLEDSNKKFNRTVIEENDEEYQQDNDDLNSHKKLVDELVMNQNEQELINDIQMILTQTAKKGKTAMKMSQKSILNESQDSAFHQENQIISTNMSPFQDIQFNSQNQKSEYLSEKLRQSQFLNSTNNQMEVINEGILCNDNPQDYYQQCDDDVPNYSSNQYKLLTDDLPSKESSNGFTNSFTNTIGDFEQPEDRLFSLQNMAIRMTQIGSGLFFNQIEKDKTQWMNPIDWKILNQKKNNIMVAEIPQTERNRTKRKNNQKDSEFRFDFFDEQEYKIEEVKGKNKKQRSAFKIFDTEITHLQLLSIDYHYKPQWLFKTSYFDLKEIEEQERLAQQRLQEEEEQYKGFNGDDEYDIINQIDEYTLLGATPFRNTQMEVMNDNYDCTNTQANNNLSQQNVNTQITSQYEHTQSYPESKNQQRKKQNVRKMKIQELKQRIWINLQDKIQDQVEISYTDLINQLQLQKQEQASIQSCLVAILHLCNENNLQLYNNTQDNFLIKRNTIQEQQLQEMSQD